MIFDCNFVISASCSFFVCLFGRGGGVCLLGLFFVYL